MLEVLLDVRNLSLAWKVHTLEPPAQPSGASGARASAPAELPPETPPSYVFRSVNFSIHAGDRLWVSGPSGCGKTSLLRSLARLEPKAEGEVLFRGQSAHGSGVPAFRRSVVYAAQTPARYPLSVEEAFLEVMEFAHRAQAFRRELVAAWCARLQLPENVFERRLTELSGGELKRVQVLRSLLAEPSLLVLDEPTAGLDEAASQALYGLLLEWVSAGERALVIVSHEAPPPALMQAEKLPRLRRFQLKSARFEELNAGGNSLCGLAEQEAGCS
ncbi:MAG: ATP-binding cassette domain-containing protein [Polyangiaceae bacterium]|nr:ATP-binding cassette domain-containing protein [Polyangiaceae bacterium]